MSSPQQPTPNEIVDFLASVTEFQGIPREQLEWLVRESTVTSYPEGLLMPPGSTIEELLIVLTGHWDAYTVQSGQKKIQMSAGPGAISGKIPFSRMTKSPVFVDIAPNSTALSLHESKFPELAHHYELTGVFVHALVDRARHFTTVHFQNEKLMALGKLSAGLAHELNNPAAAIVRNAEDLKTNIGSLAQTLSMVVSLHLEPSQLTAIGPILSKVSHDSAERMSTVDRMQREDELVDWLDSHDAAEDCAAPLLEAGLTVTDLHAIHASIPREVFPAFLSWLSSELQTQKTAHEIAIASRRISELVQSVKNYTRMDQVHDTQELCINEGIHNTLTILQHKIQRNGVTLHEELEDRLPQISGFPGELNQVWTNIIDNALDAMKKGGELTVRTYGHGGSVVFNVIDTGSGIPPENLERIFDPFFTTKDVGEGTGVGLDVVQKVVQLHHGKIEVESKPGRTEFRVTFPQAAAA